ncbi:MAG TPA: ATP-binding protein [Vicinamibacteria bacterium]|nr:ATP-binding protein [Vicinamibacteria bacterium]
MTRLVELSIDSRLEEVASVGEAVSRACREAGISEGDAYNVELAVVEAVSNSVRHAYRGEAGHRVEVRLSLAADGVEVRILDDGLPVPEASRRPKPIEFDPEDPLSISEGGRGTFLIHSLMDRVVYGSEGGRNLLLLAKSLKRS